MSSSKSLPHPSAIKLNELSDPEQQRRPVTRVTSSNTKSTGDNGQFLVTSWAIKSPLILAIVRLSFGLYALASPIFSLIIDQVRKHEGITFVFFLNLKLGKFY
ncbi:hypothetical protein DL96DRAFT_1817047 [Flagelloscypha sp. PMI_526]|nr:hypothetical protein DL96DRAFT_1817047 [Flagelloscypha sp. PMI_526]